VVFCFAKAPKTWALLLGSSELESRDQVGKDPINGGINFDGDGHLVAINSAFIGTITPIFLVGQGLSER
jgi:hypothetical protein